MNTTLTVFVGIIAFGMLIYGAANMIINYGEEEPVENGNPLEDLEERAYTEGFVEGEKTGSESERKIAGHKDIVLAIYIIME